MNFQTDFFPFTENYTSIGGKNGGVTIEVDKFLKKLESIMEHIDKNPPQRLDTLKEIEAFYQELRDFSNTLKAKNRCHSLMSSCKRNK
ncbi:hypothetical protein [Halobacillus ihumii]|uniref:hypothetical protein n=1 Tax=Halobacillus ihumii TaxID=2686092 RepID=UPI0013D80F5F|nr:hypothetical protein [Halobacillus ihumii]